MITTLLPKRFAAIAAFGLLSGLSISSHAVTYEWTGAASNIWDPTAINWVTPGPTPAAWVNGNTAFFNQPAGGTIDIGSFPSVLSVDTLQFGSSAGSYTFDNFGSSTAIELTGTGIVTSSPNSQTIVNGANITFLNSASAGTSSISITNGSALTFTGSSTAGSSVLNNDATLTFNATSSGGTATVINSITGVVDITGSASTSGLTIQNSGTIDISSHTGGVSLAAITAGPTSGAVNVGTNTLTVGSLSLNAGNPATVGTNGLSFSLTNPDVGLYPNPTTPSSGQGRIVIGSAFNVSGIFDDSIEVTLTSLGPNNVPGGTYTLMDWSSATVTGTLTADNFILSPSSTLPPNVSRVNFIVEGNKLLLVAVPEPASIAMPLAACLGLLGLRRRASKAKVTA